MSKEGRWKIRIVHIRDEIENIRLFIKGKNNESFANDKMIIYAVIRSFQIIGEATKKIPEDIRLQYPAVPWSEMARFRDKIVDDYDDVDLPMVWKIIHEELPQVAMEIEKISTHEKGI